VDDTAILNVIVAPVISLTFSAGAAMCTQAIFLRPPTIVLWFVAVAGFVFGWYVSRKISRD
jgi:hypothetical protein